jgi:hypothetical protein
VRAANSDIDGKHGTIPNLSIVRPTMPATPSHNIAVLLLLLTFFLLGSAIAQQTAAEPSQPTAYTGQISGAPNYAVSFSQVVDQLIQREQQFLLTIRYFKPLAETYLQTFKPDAELGTVPTSDQYFLGKLDLSRDISDRSLLRQSRSQRWLDKLTPTYSLKYLPSGFAQIIVLDGSGFDRQHYSFTLVRRELLGEVQCLVIQVVPHTNAGKGRFLGRIWVEEDGYHIVRFNGTFTQQGGPAKLEFDCWRLNVLPGLWLPAYVYSQESDEHGRFGRTVQFRAQTRFWGYDLQHAGDHEEYKQPLVDTPFMGNSTAGQDLNPLLSQRRMQYSAEDNVIERLQIAGLMAHHGSVDAVLETVVQNLLIANDLLDSFPDVRCRVLLTTPLESFVVGHTIVVSRGLLDVLPDEASLAAVLSHDLGHIVLRDPNNLEYGFNDRLSFPDEEPFQRLDFHRDPVAEAAADKKGLELLNNSPYQDRLQSAGLFFKAVEALAPALPNLFRARLGDAIVAGHQSRLGELKQSAPQLAMTRTDQIAALPLGARIQLNPWTDRIDLMKTTPVSILSAREKLPFEVTPFYPYLQRAVVAGKSP